MAKTVKFLRVTLCVIIKGDARSLVSTLIVWFGVACGVLQNWFSATTKEAEARLRWHRGQIRQLSP